MQENEARTSEAAAEIDAAVIGADHGFEGEFEIDGDSEANPEAGPGRWDFPPPPNYREGPEGDAEHAAWEQARGAALHGTTQADQDQAGRYLDRYFTAERDTELEAGA